MHDASLVCRGQSIGYLDSDIQDVAHLQRLCRRATAIACSLGLGMLSQCFAINELSGNEVPVLDSPDLIDRYDVRMIQRRCGPRLLLEATHAIFIPREVGR